MTWRNWVKFGMEAQFNPRVAVGSEVESILEEWAKKSLEKQYEIDGDFDISYGNHRLMKFDYFKGKADLPVIINIHGGYWRALDKSYMTHHMADLALSGFSFLNLNYPLCPEVTLTEIIKSLNDGLKAIIDHCDNDELHPKFVLMGHSAGAHISMHLSHHFALSDRLLAVVALSGIYESALVLELPVNADIKMSLDEADHWDCLKQMPAFGPSYYICAGGAEPSGWIDQSWIMANALSQRGDSVTFHVCSGANHFSLVDLLCDKKNPEGAKLHRWIASL